MIVFGTIVCAMFVGQKVLQNVLGYSTLVRLAELPATMLLRGNATGVGGIAEASVTPFLVFACGGPHRQM